MAIVSLVLANPLITLPVLGVIGTILVILYLLGILRPFGNPSPFKRASIRSPDPFEYNNSVRDKVIKNGFSAKKVPCNLDAIVIGSGIGGLSTAAIMAKTGKRVLVLEQHDQAGGCCHSFHDKKFEFDVGIHYVGDISYGKEMRVLTDLITDGQLQWHSMQDDFDEVLVENERFPISKSHDNFRKGMLKRFPDEEEAIRKYVNLLEEIMCNDWPFAVLKFLPAWLSRALMKTGLISKFSSLFEYTQLTLEQVLDGLTQNRLLKTVLSYNFGDFGVLPSDASFYLHACVINHFIKDGGYYPHGGSSEIAYRIVPIIQESGGDVLVRANVVQILHDESGQIVGVRVQKSQGSEPVDIFAPVVVSGIGLHKTKELLHPSVSERSEYFSKISKMDLKPGHAGISLFVGLKGTAEELMLHTSNNWIFNSTNPDESLRSYLSLSREEASTANVPLAFVGFPSAKDPTWRLKNPGTSTATVITFVNYEWFEDWDSTKVGKRGVNYNEFKTALGEMMWEKCLEYYPQLKDKVEYFEVGSPLTNNYYIGSSKGELYGLENSMARLQPDNVIALRPETDIAGLYVTGQDIFTAGFAGALFSGVLTSSAILGRNILVDILIYKLTEFAKDRYAGRMYKSQ